MNKRSSSVLVIGTGNDHRGDDAVGLLVARRLRARTNLEVAVHEHKGDGTTLMDAWKGAQKVIIVDAAHSDAAPGTIYRFEVANDVIPTALFSHGTHTFGVAEGIELARALHQLPPRLVLYGIEGARFQFGASLSSEVYKAAYTLLNKHLPQDIREGRHA